MNMTQIYRILKGSDLGDVLDSLEALHAFARAHAPGSCDVDEHSLDSLPGTKVTARASGKVIHHQDGQVVVDPIPWPAS
jgi:hypothetical protein